MLTVEQLRIAVDEGEIDTVVVAITDMQGRLQGKRFHAAHFLAEVLAHGTEGCNYLLAVDVDMNTVDGYAMSSWSRGYGDFAMIPDFDTLRRIPWQPGTALVLADLRWLDGEEPVAASPRQILQAQLARLDGAGYTAYTGTELEFVAYRNTYEDAFHRGYRELTPANLFNADYSLLQTARVEPLLRRIRNDMAGAGLVPESAKGECNLGQHEIAFRYDAALRNADGHVLYKNGAKEIAALEGMSITFMAKPNAREGNSCHIHFSLTTSMAGRSVTAGIFHHARWPASWPPCASSLSSTRRTSTPTSVTRPARSRRPRCGGATTTAPARCASSATDRRGGWRTGCPAPTSTPTWRSPR